MSIKGGASFASRVEKADHFTAGPTQRAKNKKEIESKLKAFNTNFMWRYGVTIEHVDLIKKSDTNNDLSVFIKEDYVKPGVAEVHNFKDRSCMADANYSGLRKLLPSLPSKYELVNYRTKLGNEIPISRNQMGFYFNCKQIISFEIERRSSELLKTEKRIKLRLAGVETQVNKVAKLKNFNYTLTILDYFGCGSAEETYTLGYFEVPKEDNLNLSKCLTFVQPCWVKFDPAKPSQKQV